MCSQNKCGTQEQSSVACHHSGNGYIIVIVLYILLAIILGSWFWY